VIYGFTCIENPQSAGKTLLASDGEDLSTPDLIRYLAELMCRSPKLFAMPPGVLRLMANIAGRENLYRRLCDSLVIDMSATQESLGWEPPYALKESLAKMVNAWHS